MMKRTWGAVAVLCLAIGAPSNGSVAHAAPCDNNSWQPTFVHDLENEDGPWYVAPQITFTKLRGNDGASWIGHACELIRALGVRDQRGFTSCQDYTRIQCGCSRNIPGNSTCAGFLQSHPRRVP